MNAKFSLDHLTSTEFEEFCFDLLKQIGFVNLNWRKGTGLSTSPSDSGRDLEGELIKSEVDGSKYIEKWFIECKQSKRGVPPGKLTNILDWAKAERPDKILIIVSNYLSNPAKDYLKKYQEINNPPFYIMSWELPELERQASVNFQILRKYNIPGQFPYLSIMHPAHVEYIKSIFPNTLEYFFSLLNSIESSKLEQILELVYHPIINPRYKTSKLADERIEDLRIDELGFNVLKQRCIQLAQLTSEQFAVSSVVNAILKSLLTMGDTTAKNILIKQHQQLLELFKESFRQGIGDPEQTKRLISFEEQHIEKLPDNLEVYKQLYNLFCDKVVKELSLEDIKLNLSNQNIIRFV